jgi:polysaccharide export outer membrane protein
MMLHRKIAIGLAVLALSGCATTRAAEAPPSRTLSDYHLGAGDKIRIIVYNEPTLSADYAVNANGSLSLPLIGDVRATARTASDLRAEIEQRLGAGYLRRPQVSIDVLVFRPFYILGEVQKPGEYAYSTGMTVLKAVATAQGFTYRADTHHVYLKTAEGSKEVKYPLANIDVQPGDTIRIGQRYF